VTRVVIALAVALGMLVLTPSPSWACSCAMVSTDGHVANAETVAAGTVDWTATDGLSRTYKVDFDQVYKGAAGGSEKLTTQANEASCGLGDLATGKRYLFFIQGRHSGVMTVNLCGGTVAYTAAIAHQVEAITGPPGKPVSAVTAETEPGGVSSGWIAGIGALALLVLAAVAVVVRRRAG
jgi:MYXO-CTERM domain-containing protein